MQQRVVAVTGGGGGIGAAIAEELGRRGHFVVTMDPLVTLDGTAPLPAESETTAGRIVAAGGSARATAVSVTDAAAVHQLFTELVDELGRLDAVINVAGITRRTGYASGTEEDWHGVLAVHLDGYRNILQAALPIMAAAGHGHILGVTSGSGWRPADTGAYGCAKRAVAALTWQLGARPPQGVTVNAMSPIAVTRMVTAALARAGSGRGPGSVTPGSSTPSTSSTTGGLSLASMPDPADLGPLGAHLVDDDLAWCSGQVIFAGGSEVALIGAPQLLEVLRTDQVASPAHALEAFTTRALVPAESSQSSDGGSNPRFGPDLGSPDAGPLPATAVGSCAIVTNQPDLQTAVADALRRRGVSCQFIEAGAGTSFAAAGDALTASIERDGPVDAVVLALAGTSSDSRSPGTWERVLAEHDGIVDGIRTDAAWTRAVVDHSSKADRPVRVVALTDATTAGGRSRAQASAQLSRASSGATKGRVAGLTVSLEGAAPNEIAELVAHLTCSTETLALAGAELAAGAGWFGLRGHPRPVGTISLDGTSVPPWFDDVLRDIAGVPAPNEEASHGHIHG